MTRNNLHPHQEYGEQVLAMMDSLTVAMFHAHAALPTNKWLENTTIKEFILQMASNGIRFVHVNKENKNDKE